jgi:hypothetical protein
VTWTDPRPPEATGPLRRDEHSPADPVANYLTSVFANLAVTDRSPAIVKARDAGLGR